MLKIRKPTICDMKLYFDWSNDSEVRAQSFNSSPIEINEHKLWFEFALEDKNCFMYIFQNSISEDLGQVRINKVNNDNAIISISIDLKHRGKGYAKQMLNIATNLFLELNKGTLISAYIKCTNSKSAHAFENAGFEFVDKVKYKGIDSLHYIKGIHENR